MKEIMKTEIYLLENLVHPNLVSFVGAYMKDEITIWMVMEWMDYGTLTSVRSQRIFNESHISYCLREVCFGLLYLHSMERIHRDLKTANVFISGNGDVKIADFDYVTQEDQLTTLMGTPYWLAPELIKEKEHASSADVWSIGVLAYELAEGFPPFHDLPPLQALFIITTEGLPTLPVYINPSEDFQAFIDYCVQMDPELRPPVEILLAHPFMDCCCELVEFLVLLGDP